MNEIEFSGRSLDVGGRGGGGVDLPPDPPSVYIDERVSHFPILISGGCCWFGFVSSFNLFQQKHHQNLGLRLDYFIQVYSCLKPNLVWALSKPKPICIRRIP